MRRGILISILGVAGVLGVLAGTFYDRTYFAGDVGLYTWTAPTNFAAAPTSGGEYTNAATVYYRICGTNSAGRTPWVTNSIALGGGTASNAVALTWSRRDGVTGYWLERSTNGTSWTNHRTLAVSAVSYTDTHATNWTAGTNANAAISAPTVPWSTLEEVTNVAQGVSLSYAQITNQPTQGSAAGYNVGGLTGEILVNGADSTGLVFPYVSDSAFYFDNAADHRTRLGLGSASINATTDFAAASHNQALATITNAGTIAGRASNDFLLASSGTVISNQAMKTRSLFPLYVNNAAIYANIAGGSTNWLTPVHNHNAFGGGWFIPTAEQAKTSAVVGISVMMNKTEVPVVWLISKAVGTGAGVTQKCTLAIGPAAGDIATHWTNGLCFALGTNTWLEVQLERTAGGNYALWSPLTVEIEVGP